MRFRIPPGPIVGVVMMAGLAFTLIVVIIARSPYTHGNLRAEGYNRTDIIYVDEEQHFEGPGLADPRLADTGDPVLDGRILFFANGCASCHGLNGAGATIGKDLTEDSVRKITTKVRNGPKGMPAFYEDVLTNSELEKLIAFLQSPVD